MCVNIFISISKMQRCHYYAWLLPNFLCVVILFELRVSKQQMLNYP